MQGKFITIEGGEGVGKTTNITYVKAWLEQHGIDYIATREPGGTPVAEKIRKLLLDHHEENIDPMAELLLIFAARAQHLNRVIRPALERGQWVLCDRFTDATYAYQGGGRELGLEKVAVLEDFVQGALRPNLTLILDVEPKIGLKRATRRGELDRFESEKMVFFEKIRATYLALAARDPARYAVVDASQPLDVVQRAISRAFDEKLLGERNDT